MRALQGWASVPRAAGLSRARSSPAVRRSPRWSGPVPAEGNAPAPPGDAAGPAAGRPRRRDSHRTGNPPNRALLVGISRYEELGSNNGDVAQTYATRCDVEAHAASPSARSGFGHETGLVLTEGQADQQKIVKALPQPPHPGRRPGDVVVFYFSGDGQAVTDPEAFGGLRDSSFAETSASSL